MQLSKTEIQEWLGRDVDEIEDVRRSFETTLAECYSNPNDGDFISDDYFKVIDLTTKPGDLNDSNVRAVNRAISHLNDVYPTIERQLLRADLLDTYLSVAEQVNTINTQDAKRAHQIATLVLPAQEADATAVHTIAA